jgi:hypothetical protein
MGNLKPQMKQRTDNKNCQMKNEKIQTMICKSLHRKQIDRAIRSPQKKMEIDRTIRSSQKNK